MTARPVVRRRRTQVGAALTLVLAIGAGVAAIIAISTLRTSEIGQEVAVDSRVEVAFPATPNAAVAVVDDEDRLTSLAIATLSPEGVGGSLVVVPVNVDTTLGSGDERLPLSRQPFAPSDPARVSALVTELESVLSTTIQGGMVLGPDELVDFVEPYSPLDVELPEKVIDADSSGAGVVSVEGARSLSADRVVDVFTAINIEGMTYDHHDVDVAMWSVLAAAISSAPRPFDVPTDDFGRPVPPTSPDAVLERLVAGPVAVRDLAVDLGGGEQLTNPGGSDFVLLDRRDALLVFSGISPGLVSTPNPSLSFQVVARFSDEQLESLGDDVTTAGLMTELIGEVIFSGGNVVSVQTAPAEEGATEVTRLEVADAALVDDVREFAAVLFGEIEVVVASRVVDGVDVVATLGTDFVDRRAEMDAEQTAADSDRDGEDDADAVAAIEADDDVADPDDNASVGEGEGAAAPVSSEPNDDSGFTRDTVVSDE